MANQLPDIHAGSAALQNVLAAGQNLQAAYAQTAKTGDYLAKAGEIMFQQGKAMQEEEHRKWERGYKERVFKEQQDNNAFNKDMTIKEWAQKIREYNEGADARAADLAKTKAEIYGYNLDNERKKMDNDYLKKNPQAHAEILNNANGTNIGSVDDINAKKAQEQENQGKIAQAMGESPQAIANSANLTARQQKLQNAKNAKDAELESNMNGSAKKAPQSPNNIISERQNNSLLNTGSAVDKNLAAAAGNYNSGVALPTQKDGWA